MFVLLQGHRRAAQIDKSAGNIKGVVFQALLLLLSPWTSAAAFITFVLSRASLPFLDLLADLYGPGAMGFSDLPPVVTGGGTALAAAASSAMHQCLLLLFAAPVLPVLLFGVAMPVWYLCALIAVAPPAS